MELKPGYKQTEVGVIPNDWEVAQVNQIATIKTGPFGTLLKASEYSPNGVPLISVGEIRQGFLHISDTTPRVSAIVTKRLPQYLLRAGDIVFGRKGGVDRSAPIRQEQDGWFLGSDGLMVRADASHNHEYLTFQFLTQRVRSWLLENATGTTMPSLNQRVLGGVQVPIPPLIAEQDAIVRILCDAEALIESLQQLLVKKRQIKQGAMQDLLTGKKRLPGFIDPWVTQLLGNIARIKTGTRNNEDKTEGGNYPFFVRSDNVERINSYSYDCEAILVPGEGRIGEIFHYVAGRFDVHQRVYAITQFEPGISAKFVHLYMTMKFGKWAMQNSVKATVDSLRLPTFQAFEMRVPATETEQVAIALALAEMEAEMAAIEIKLTKVRQLKQGMMQELLTGRIRLVRPSAEVLSFPARESAVEAKASHNTQINEAVVIAVLSAKFGSEKFPLGRFRRTKFSYLLHRHTEHEAAGFMKKAAGPYNPRTRYGGAEKIALKNRYVRVLSVGKSEGFVADENIAQAEGYFEKWYGTEALTWLEQFHYYKNDALELLTTVDMACEDLSRAGKAVTLSTVKQVIRDNPEWKPKLDRPEFSDGNIERTIQSCSQLFPLEKE